MDVIKIEISKLAADPNNARKHSDKNLKAIKGSLAKFGQQKPIVIDSKNVVIAGNGTMEAAKQLGWTHINAVVTELDELGKMAFALADNKTSDLSEFDDDILKGQLDWLDKQDFDIGDIGFDDFDLPDDNEGTDGLTDPDEVPEVPKNVFGVKRGDVWLLGNHRLMCGDSTDENDVKKLMDGQKADMVFTDPPYNIASDSKNFASDVSKSMNKLSNSDWDKNFKIEPALDRLKDSISENATMYIWTSHFLINDVWEHLKEFGYINYLVWSKPNPMPSLSKRHPAWNTELCVYASRGSKRVVNYPVQGHFLSCREVIKKSDGTHPTQKPLELITPIIEFSSNQGQMILDLFLGSGSTLIACEKTGRTCFGMELDEHYCSVIIKRWQDFTGKQAVKDGGVFNG
jgi:site-specific DNA-methyltransferase (adenine-specific)